MTRPSFRRDIAKVHANYIGGPTLASQTSNVPNNHTRYQLQIREIIVHDPYSIKQIEKSRQDRGILQVFWIMFNQAYSLDDLTKVPRQYALGVKHWSESIDFL